MTFESIFQENCAGIKPVQNSFRLEMSPSGLLCSFFQLQNEQKKVQLLEAETLEDPYGQQLYLRVSAISF